MKACEFFLIQIDDRPVTVTAGIADNKMYIYQCTIDGEFYSLHVDGEGWSGEGDADLIGIIGKAIERRHDK